MIPLVGGFCVHVMLRGCSVGTMAATWLGWVTKNTRRIQTVEGKDLQRQGGEAEVLKMVADQQYHSFEHRGWKREGDASNNGERASDFGKLWGEENAPPTFLANLREPAQDPIPKPSNVRVGETISPHDFART